MHSQIHMHTLWMDTWLRFAGGLEIMLRAVRRVEMLGERSPQTDGYRTMKLSVSGTSSDVGEGLA